MQFLTANNELPPSRLGFKTAILIIALLQIFFATALLQDVINLPANEAVAAKCGKVAIDNVVS